MARIPHPAIENPRRWQAVRRAVFKRDGYRCRSCGKAGRLECDHVVAIFRGGDWWAVENCQALCRGLPYSQDQNRTNQAQCRARRMETDRPRRVANEAIGWGDMMSPQPMASFVPTNRLFYTEHSQQRSRLPASKSPAGVPTWGGRFGPQAANSSQLAASQGRSRHHRAIDFLQGLFESRSPFGNVNTCVIAFAIAIMIVNRRANRPTQSWAKRVASLASHVKLRKPRPVTSSTIPRAVELRHSLPISMSHSRTLQNLVFSVFLQSLLR